MQLQARLIQVLPAQTGEGRNGPWKKQDIIVETDGQYPKKVCVSIWGDKISESQLQIGNMLDLSFDVESREFNGKWYTDVKAWKVELVGQGGAPAPAAPASQPSGYAQPKQEYAGDPFSAPAPGKDDLPF